MGSIRHSCFELRPRLRPQPFGSSPAVLGGNWIGAAREVVSSDLSYAPPQDECVVITHTFNCALFIVVSTQMSIARRRERLGVLVTVMRDHKYAMTSCISSPGMYAVLNYNVVEAHVVRIQNQVVSIDSRWM